MLFLAVLGLMLFVGCKRDERSAASDEQTNLPAPVEVSDVLIPQLRETLYVSAMSGLNLRTEPGLTGRVIKILPQNTELLILDISNEKITIDGLTNFWYQVYIGEEIGWVFGGHVLRHEEKGFEISIIDGTVRIDDYLGNTQDIQIPSKIQNMSVTGIGNDALRGNFLRRLNRVLIPDSIISIGNGAFMENALSSVIIPNTVTFIGDYAFADNQLTSVVISESITSIEAGTFFWNQLTSVVIPNGVISIGEDAFRRNLLTSVIIPNSVTSIGTWAFVENNLTNVIIPNSVTYLSGFNFNQLTSVIIPDSVVTIGFRAFERNRLTSIHIPDSVTSINAWAFSTNQITSVIIPESVMSIGIGAFAHNQLSKVIIPNSLSVIERFVFRENQLSSVIIPNNIIRIEDEAFIGNPLTSITIGANVVLGALAFGHEFETFYNKNGRQAGTYVLVDSQWRMENSPQL